MPHQRQSLELIAAVDVHLPATRLRFRKRDFVTQPLQNLDHGLSGFREKGVVITGDKERNAHVWILLAGAALQCTLPTRRAPVRALSIGANGRLENLLGLGLVGTST